MDKNDTTQHGGHSIADSKGPTISGGLSESHFFHPKGWHKPCMKNLFFLKHDIL